MLRLDLNCRIAIPVESCGIEAEVEQEVVEEPEEKESPVGNLFGGLRNKLETMTNSVTDLDGEEAAPDAEGEPVDE